MIHIKTATQIFESLKDFTKKTQDKITDFSVTSTTSGFLYAVASEIENIYTDLEYVKKQAFLATATGKNVDLHIEGSYGVPRGGGLRASGYGVLYANAPLQNTAATKIWVAKYDKDTDQFDGIEKAYRVISSGSDAIAGRVFTLAAPNNLDYVKYDDVQKGWYIDFKNLNPQFLVLPLVATLRGTQSNVPEDSINVLSESIPGIIGIYNTYNPIQKFFNEDATVDMPSTSVLGFNGTTNQLDIVSGKGFNETGLLQLENPITGKLLKGIFKASDQSVLTVPIKLSYTQAFNKYIILDQIEERPTMSVVGRDLSAKTYTLDKIIFEGAEESYVDFRVYLQSKLTGTAGKYTVRGARADVDRRLFFDPDLVIDDSGKLLENAYVGGGSDEDSDDVYKAKLRQYLDSLARATPKALESGALTVKGINYAKVLPKHMSPRGTSTLLVSGIGGIVTNKQLDELKVTLETSWKAAGEHLIIKTPERVEVTSMIQLSIFPGYSKDLITTKVKAATRTYISSLTPGSIIEPNTLISLLKTIDGVKSVRNVFLGKLLGSDTYNYSNITAKEVLDLNYVQGYSLSLLSRLYNTKDASITSPDSNNSVTYVSVSPSRKIAIKRVTRDVNGGKVITDVIGSSIPDKFIEFMTRWHNLGSGSTVDIYSLPDYTSYTNIFKSNTTFTNTVKPLMKLAFKDSYEYEVVRYMTEPLDSTKRASISLPIEFDALRVSDTEEYRLSLYQIPVVATFNDGLETIDLIGVEYV